MATKAVHLELVSDLTTSAFLAALRRMAARRGTPRHMYSDNGTNFVGASHVLQQQFQELQEQAIPGIINMEIEWHFNAPSWPSAGGLWEAGIKSLKYHMRRVIGEQKLTYEELSTILTQIEACLNSRPLCPITEDPEDLDVLTPSHFLGSGPNLTIYETEQNLPIRWQLTRKIYHDIWSRWQSEYLTQLNARCKWKQAKRELKVNDIVIINDLNLPPGKWVMGRVTELHPGQDGHVRVVTVKTKNGLMKRPIVKLSVLPVHEISDSNLTDNQHKTQTISQNNIELQKTNKPARKRIDFATMAVTFLLFFMTLISSSQCTYNMNKLPINQSLYFDKISNMHLIRDEWNLVVYFDTNPYWDGVTALSKNIDYLTTVCTQIDTMSHCEGILTQLRHGYQEIQHYNRILLNQQNDARARQKRGLIDGVGYLANGLFGILDQHFAENYERDIKTIKINQNHMALLWKNQTSIVEAEFNLLKRTETIMDKQYKAINQKMLNLENTVGKLKSSVQNCTIITDFTLSALIANNLLLELKNIQNKLIDTLTDIYHGKFNLHLISPQQLKQELDVISSQLPKDLSSPVDGMEFAKIYHLLMIRARMSKHFFIFEIKIPLITRDAYEILKIIPVPHIMGSQMIEIVPVSEYVAINLKKDALLSLSKNDISSCPQQNLGTILCSIKKPIYTIKDDQSLCRNSEKPGVCKTRVSICANKWIELNNLNHFMYFCCEPCRLRLLCQDQITAIELTQAGLLNVGQGCVIKSQNFSLYGHKQGSSKTNISPDIGTFEIAPINHIINIAPVPYQSLSNDTDYNRQQELANIQNRLNEIKHINPLTEDIRFHDVHHYAAIYTIIGIMLLGGALVLGCRIRRLRGWRVRARSTAALSPSGAEDPAVLQPTISAISVSEVMCECPLNRSRKDLNECHHSAGQAPTTSRNKRDQATSPVLKSVFNVISEN